MSLNAGTVESAVVQQMLSQTDALIVRRYPVLRSLVIAQDGQILCARRYGKAAIDRDGEYALAPVKSVTKSIVSILIGMLIDRKLIAGVEQPLSELFAGKSDYLQANPLAAKLTLHQLLSMTSGFTWRTGRAGMEPLAARMMAEQDWLRFILALPVVSSEVGQFRYNSAVSHLLSVIVQEASGDSAAEFARKNLFAPLNIDDFAWESDPCGNSVGGWGLSLSALSMARIGQLCIDQGMYNGRRVVAAEWIRLMSTAVCEVDSLHGKNQPQDYHPARYGYQWWVRGNDNIQLFCAEGAGGQMILCLPGLRAVIVISTEYTRRGITLWPLIEKYWIPLLL